VEESPRVNTGCTIPLGKRSSYMSCVKRSYKPHGVGPVSHFICSTTLLLMCRYIELRGERHQNCTDNYA